MWKPFWKFSRTRSLPDVRELSAIVFDFDGIFTDNKVYTDAGGVESVMCDRRDGLGISVLKKWIGGMDPKPECYVLSTEANPTVAFRCRKLGLHFYQSCDNKLDFLLKRHGESGLGSILYVGNDINDLASINACGFSAAPRDATSVVKHSARWVSNYSGGHLFIRDLVEKLLTRVGIDFEAYVP